MNRKHYAINKYASIMNRLGNMYFDQCMAPYGLGSGQLFFLLRLSEKEGCSLWELAQQGKFDKGTATRAVQKLEELEYLYRENDTKDKRIQRLYVSEKGRAILPHIKACLHSWEEIVLEGIDDETAKETLKVLQQMSENASAFIKERKREQYERNHHK